MRFIVIIIATLIVMLPAAIFGIPTLGVYFSDVDHATVPGQMHYIPTPATMFYGFVYAHNWDCYLTAAEFAVEFDPQIIYAGFDIPEGWLFMGDPINGLSLTWWPPISDYYEDYHWLCVLKMMIFEPCITEGGTLADMPIVIVPHPVSGGMYGVCWPGYQMFNFVVGQKSIVCPYEIDIEDQSWGAIKAQFK
ncbi:MAG: hypothetical protein KAX38_03990 [Candidatus Krumholzibacteria bacterium]|nr:hypothetical protein [Candidatus Krumholzibacteria bacterium]